MCMYVPLSGFIVYCFQGLPAAAPILFSFGLPVCNARPIYIYIYIYI